MVVAAIGYFIGGKLFQGIPRTAPTIFARMWRRSSIPPRIGREPRTLKGTTGVVADERTYFDRRETSDPVEGSNNKASVITRRSYGLKIAGSRSIQARFRGHCT